MDHSGIAIPYFCGDWIPPSIEAVTYFLPIDGDFFTKTRNCLLPFGLMESFHSAKKIKVVFGPSEPTDLDSSCFNPECKGCPEMFRGFGCTGYTR